MKVLGVCAVLALPAIYASEAGLNPLPVVFYHGMGDSCCNPQSIGKLSDAIKAEIEGVYVTSIKIGDTENQERRKGYMDNLDRQIDEVCRTLKSDERLRGGFHGVGISQGGQFLRAYVERCNDPPVKTLVTIGAQHMGVSDIPKCSNDATCRLVRGLIQRAVYSSWVQKNVVQAQYFKDPNRIDDYLAANVFLTDINNEISVNETFKTNLMSLDKLVLIKFANDLVVTPKETSHFGYWKDGELKPLQQLEIYTKDRVGLKKMDEAGKVDFLTWPGDHLQFSLTDFVDKIVLPYFAGKKKSTTPDVNAFFAVQQ